MPGGGTRPCEDAGDDSSDRDVTSDETESSLGVRNVNACEVDDDCSHV